MFDYPSHIVRACAMILPWKNGMQYFTQFAKKTYGYGYDLVKKQLANFLHTKILSKHFFTVFLPFE
jgi:hypothetical protein